MLLKSWESEGSNEQYFQDELCEESEMWIFCQSFLSMMEDLNNISISI